jgi:hypothetical protein
MRVCVGILHELNKAGRDHRLTNVKVRLPERHTGLSEEVIFPRTSIIVFKF